MITNKKVYAIYEDDVHCLMMDTDKDFILKRIEELRYMNPEYRYEMVIMTDDGSLAYQGIPCCKACGTAIDISLRHDWYGIPTGEYCDHCYKTNYPYRKDRYPTIEYDGYGERLDELE